jgi:hypothetical protein
MAFYVDQWHVHNNLESWKFDMLRVWSENTSRAIYGKDLACFSDILNVPAEVIETVLNQMRAGYNADPTLSPH